MAPAFSGLAYDNTNGLFYGVGNDSSSFSTLWAHIDPGRPTLSVFVSNGSAAGSMELTGYLQNCSVVPCIAQQN